MEDMVAWAVHESRKGAVQQQDSKGGHQEAHHLALTQNEACGEQASRVQQHQHDRPNWQKPLAVLCLHTQAVVSGGQAVPECVSLQQQADGEEGQA